MGGVRFKKIMWSHVLSLFPLFCMEPIPQVIIIQGLLTIIYIILRFSISLHSGWQICLVSFKQNNRNLSSLWISIHSRFFCLNSSEMFQFHSIRLFHSMNFFFPFIFLRSIFFSLKFHLSTLNLLKIRFYNLL
jgi:hypothetical protein